MKRTPFTALDGSTITELVRPEDGTERLSLARARVEAGHRTWRHYHRAADEIYYVLSGTPLIHVGERVVQASPGDAVLIPAGAEHFLVAVGAAVEILCACSPPYGDEDTELLEAVV